MKGVQLLAPAEITEMHSLRIAEFAANASARCLDRLRPAAQSRGGVGQSARAVQNPISNGDAIENPTQPTWQSHTKKFSAFCERIDAPSLLTRADKAARA
jgi:hypothetical protein